MKASPRDKEKNLAELTKKAAELKKEIALTRSRLAAGKEKNTAQVRNKRQERARLLTQIGQLARQQQKEEAK